MRKIAWLALLLLAPLAAAERSRVFFMSFDALGYERLTADPAAEPLSALRAMMRTGAWAEGLIPAYPSTTANGHAALWTGTYAGANGILYNQTPATPRSEHAFTDRVIGFRSEALTAEPIWLTAARQGKRVVAHQVTQVFPFTPQTVGSGPMPNLVVANGFQSRSFAPWQLVRPGAEGVRKVECPGSRACFEWTSGKSTFRAEVIADGLRIQSGSAAVEVRSQPEETEAPAKRALARRWSAGLEVDGLPAFVAFRLFSLAPDGSDFELLQTPIQEMAIYADSRANAEVARDMQLEVGPAVGNAAGSLWTRKLINERRYLETLELVIRQQIAEVKWLAAKRDPDLLITYVSAIDDLDHLWYGFGEPYREWRRWGYVAVNQAAEALLGLASRHDHVVVTSDHGMAPVEWYVGMNKVLQAAGLKDKAVALSTCVLLNTDDWKGGTVTAAEREGVLDQVAAALTAVRSEDGLPVVTKVYRSQEDLRSLGHAGPAGADLCFDLQPRFGPRESGDGGVVQKAVRPVGAHGFDPGRVDMKAVLMVTGPRAAPGKPMGPQRSASVATLVADLLQIGPPKDAAFASPLAVRARDIGLAPGVFPPGRHNTITDVAGVRVGHKTLIQGSTVRTGVTAILPHGGNVFDDKVAGAVFIGNAFGKLAGSTQVNELGQIETPIVLTNTLSVGTAMEAVVGYTLRLPGNERVRSVNALVGETNDSKINDIRGMHVRREHVLEAIQRASEGPVIEGSVGAGTGTSAFGWKGGIGTSSRVLPAAAGGYTVGVLVQTNFGGVLTMGGAPVGKELGRYNYSQPGDGSCMIVVATDAPIDARDLGRLAARAVFGLGRTGSDYSNGSGDYAIAFTTSSEMRTRHGERGPRARSVLTPEAVSPLFEAALEATEEAVYNSLLQATKQGDVEPIPVDRVRGILRKYVVAAAGRE